MGIDMRDPANRAVVQRRTVIVLVIAQVIGTVGVGVGPTIGILLAETVTGGEAWAGLARTSSTLGAALAGVPLGNLAARRGRRFSLASGWWIAAAGSLLLVFAAQWLLIVPLFAGLLLIGVGLAVSLQARFAATDLASPRSTARSLAVVVWAGTFGSVAGTNLGVPGELLGSVSRLTTYASAFLIACICLTIAGLIVLVWLHPDPLMISGHAHHMEPAALALAGDGRFRRLLAEFRAAHGTGDGDFRRLVAEFRAHRAARDGGIRRLFVELRVNRAARTGMIAILAGQIVVVAIMTMTPVHLERCGVPLAIIGLVISLQIIGRYGPAPLAGLLVDRRGHRLVIVTGAALLATSVLVGVIRPEGTPWIATSLILLGVGWSFTNVGGSALLSTTLPVSIRAPSQGAADTLTNLCGATTALLSGPIMAATSFSTLSLVAALALIPLIAALPGTPAAGLRLSWPVR